MRMRGGITTKYLSTMIVTMRVTVKLTRIMVLRPDQYVSYVGEIEDVHDLDVYFKGILKDASEHIAPTSKSISRQLPPGFIAKFENELNM